MSALERAGTCVHEGGGLVPLQCGHCFSTTGYPGLPDEHGHGGAGGEQCDITLRCDRYPGANGHVASWSRRHNHPVKLARGYVSTGWLGTPSPYLASQLLVDPCFHHSAKTAASTEAPLLPSLLLSFLYLLSPLPRLHYYLPLGLASFHVYCHFARSSIPFPASSVSE